MKKIIINEEAWQIRVAITEDGVLQNIYFWSRIDNHLERCFFKGLVTKVLPGIQTAFVDIGQERSGFLHISEIDRDMAIHKLIGDDAESFDTSGAQEPQPEKRERRQSADIAKILNENETILVQVSKEPVNEKGAKLTTCFTLPGRFIVLMPNIPRIGISKKIVEREERIRVKEIISKALPEGMGAIIRTCSQGRSEEEIKKDVDFLIESWNEIISKEKTSTFGSKIHQDIGLPFQIIRDHLDDDIEQVIIDNQEKQSELVRYVKRVAPEYAPRIHLYTGKNPIFEYFDIEKQIQETLNKKVELRSGGSIVIETTEAMTVVDVNTGRFVGKSNLEDTILKTNLEAAHEIIRQLKIRNIGGLIVIDFIDMAFGANKQKLFHTFEKTLREQDKSQSVVLRISEFGLVQMTRKRTGKTLEKQLLRPCAECHGVGRISSIQTESYALLRALKAEFMRKQVTSNALVIRLHPTIFDYISKNEYEALFEFERKYQCKMVLESDASVAPHHFKIEPGKQTASS